MTLHDLSIVALLIVVVLSCWLGVFGMLWMKHPLQSLHYLSIPATVGILALSAALFIDQGWSALSVKTVLIAVVLLGINSVVTHALARAFRARQLGHWEPRDGDPLEWVPSSHHPAGGGKR